MKVRLVSHASVLIESDDCVVWTDPWLTGKVFNDSWSLLPSAVWDSSLLGKIDYIWISHEHPDHFNIPTLRLLPEWFKRKTTILFQDLNSTKMVKAFMDLGFCNVRLLGHGKIEQLTPGTRAYCYYAGLMDSCLAVSDGMHTVFDVNDAQLTSRDCRRIVADIGQVDALLNQFSIAFYSGLLDHQQPLRRMAIGILDRMYRNHVGLKAQVTIPFASLMYFSSSENKYINEFHNTPASVFERLNKAGASVVVLYPGDVYELGQMYDSNRALTRYEKTYAERVYLPYDMPPRLEFDQIAQAFYERVEHLHEKYPAYLLRVLRPVRLRITDLGIDAVFSVSGRSFEIAGNQAEPDMLVGSQPLHFAFKNTYGFQTLGISGRIMIPAESQNLRLHRLLFALDNAELYLRPRLLMRRATLKFLRQRSSGGVNLLLYVIERMRHISPLEGFQG